MVNTENLNKKQIKDLPFTKEELAALGKARTMPISFDKDCPETTPEKAVMFRRVNPRRIARAD